MKNLYKVLAICIIAILFQLQSKAQTCCPVFYLQSDIVHSCDSGANGTSGNPGLGKSLNACKNSYATYYAVPSLPGFTYNWVVTGGTPSSFTGNPITILWDTVSSGTLTCYISDATGACKDTLNNSVTILSRPIASFTKTPNTSICPSTTITFNNTSNGGNYYSWNFGDGANAVGASVTHFYTTPGTYSVTLTVSTMRGTDQCGCTDTATQIVTVSNGTVPTITSSCKQMLCPGDTANYCVTPLCPPYTWTVDGGTIVGSATGACINVLWNTPPTNYPPSVHVIAGTCSGQCSNIGALNVPVLYNNLPIGGKSVVCNSTMQSYSIMSSPGTFYKWTLSGGGNIFGPDSNTTSINIGWNGVLGSSYLITCTYNNPITGCSGTSTKLVTIQPEFKIGFSIPYCVGSNGFAFTLDGNNANFSILPSTGFTPTSPFANTNNIGMTWLLPNTYEIFASPVTASNYCTASINLVW